MPTVAIIGHSTITSEEITKKIVESQNDVVLLVNKDGSIIPNEDALKERGIEIAQIEELLEDRRDNNYLFTNPYKDLPMRIMEDIKNPHLTKKQQEAIIHPVRNSKKDPKIDRNAPCPCGSGKKYKKCCMIKKLKEQ